MNNDTPTTTDFVVDEGPAAWRASDFTGTDWIDVLSPSQKEELDSAARALPSDESEWLKMTREDLSLPTLGPLMAEVTRELDSGRGFAILRGIDLPPTDLDYVYRVKWILALGFGDVIAQNANGELIGAVQAESTAEVGSTQRGYLTNAEMRFHSDGGDVVTLLCVRQAAEGGISTLVSLISVHNTMVKECPQHLAALYRGLPIYMRKEGELDSSTSARRRPIFTREAERVFGWCNLVLMELPYETSGEAMEADTRAALDVFEEIAERPENKISLKLEPGDMLLCHNYICMHKRSTFTIDPDPNKARLMLRLWYNIPGGCIEAITPPKRRAGYFKKMPYVIRHKD